MTIPTTLLNTGIGAKHSLVLVWPCSIILLLFRWLLTMRERIADIESPLLPSISDHMIRSALLWPLSLHEIVVIFGLILGVIAVAVCCMATHVHLG